MSQSENVAIFDRIKDKIGIVVVSAAQNKEKLSHVPHEKMEDLAVVYSLGAGDKVGMITNEDLKKMGITEDQLRHAAMEQAPKSHQLTIKTIEEALGIPDSTELESQKLFVASTADAFLGAGVIAYPGFMEKAAEITGGDFYVLPSSIHEVLLMQDCGESNAAGLKAMVKSINETEVSPEERLTNNVYHYDSREKIFETADKFEARMEKEKEAEKSTEKSSVLDKLDAGKEQADKDISFKVKVKSSKNREQSR